MGPIQPSRGPRQSNPLSPYMFLFCIEGLSHSLSTTIANGQISGCQITTDAPRVSHLLYAGDNFLFFKVMEAKAVNVKRVLYRYKKNFRTTSKLH